MTHETLDFKKEDSIAWVRLDRPKRLNAISPQMLTDLRAVLADVRADEEIRVLVFIGAGRAFSAGADLSELVGMASSTKFMRYLESIQSVFNEIETFPKPVIAAVNGIAYGGGCELAISCDFRLMAASAKIGVPEILIGVLPGAGGTQRLPRLLPPAIAKQMILLGEPLDAETAVRHGLANVAVPDDRLEDTAREWAKRLAALPPLALASGKMLVRAAGNADQASGMDAERQTVGFLYGTEDGREGMKAFLQKRAPKFQGK